MFDISNLEDTRKQTSKDHNQVIELAEGRKELGFPSAPSSASTKGREGERISHSENIVTQE